MIKTRIKIGFWGKNQTALFEIYKEWLYEGNVEYAEVIFSIGNRFGGWLHERNNIPKAL